MAKAATAKALPLLVVVGRDRGEKLVDISDNRGGGVVASGHGDASREGTISLTLG